MTEEQAFIKALKRAYVACIVEIGHKNREIKRLEGLVNELSDRLSMQHVRTGESDVSSDGPPQEALQRDHPQGQGDFRGNEPTEDTPDGQEVRLPV
jgi:hypothetical protein